MPISTQVEKIMMALMEMITIVIIFNLKLFTKKKKNKGNGISGKSDSGESYKDLYCKNSG